MRRFAPALAVLGLTALGATALSAGPAGARSASAPSPAPVTSAPPRAALSRISCHHALDPAARYVSLTAVMRPLPGTERLSVRFHLLERPDGASGYTAPVAPGLDEWISPKDPSTLGQRPGDVWKVVKPIADLAAPAIYRFAVDFRWTGADGHVLGSVTRLSHRCFQPELRPDLVVRSISVSPAGAQLDSYQVVIANTGPTGAGPFTVALYDAGTQREQTVQHLAGHSAQTLQFIGPSCQSAQPPRVVADPMDQVDVSTRAQASLVAVCPS